MAGTEFAYGELVLPGGTLVVPRECSSHSTPPRAAHHPFTQIMGEEVALCKMHMASRRKQSYEGQMAVSKPGIANLLPRLSAIVEWP